MKMMNGNKTTSVLRARFVVVVALGVLLVNAAYAQNTLNSMILRTSDAEVDVELNGFTIISETTGEAVQIGRDVSRMLVDGANTIDVEFVPLPGYNPQTDDPPRLTIEIIRRTMLAGGYKAVPIIADTVTAGTIHVGAFDVQLDQMTFAADAGGFAWEFSFSNANQYDRIPTKLFYFAASEPVDSMTVSFSNAAQNQVVVYDNIPATDVHGEIDLSALTPTSGGQFLDSTGFTRVRFFYTGGSALQWQTVYLQRLDLEELFSVDVGGAGATPLTLAVLGRGTVVTGSVSVTTLLFADKGASWAWAFEFDPSDAFGRIPTEIVYRTGNLAVAEMTVQFANGDDSHVVTYSGVTFPTGIAGVTVDLSSLVPTAGAQWLNESDFSKLSLSYTAPNSQLQLANFSLRRAGGSLSESFIFTASIPQTWAWQSAQPGNFGPGDEAAVAAILASLQTAMAAADANAASTILDTKAREIAKLRYSAPDAAVIEQRDYFVTNLFADPDWAMEPLDTADLVYTLMGGGLVVHVTHTNRPYALRSVPIEYKGAQSRFNLDPYLSKIPDGQGGFEWQVIW